MRVRVLPPPARRPCQPLAMCAQRGPRPTPARASCDPRSARRPATSPRECRRRGPRWSARASPTPTDRKPPNARATPAASASRTAASRPDEDDLEFIAHGLRAQALQRACDGPESVRRDDDGGNRCHVRLGERGSGGLAAPALYHTAVRASTAARPSGAVPGRCDARARPAIECAGCRSRLDRRSCVVAAFVCAALCASAALAQPQPVRVVTAVRAVPPPVIDGRLDDPVWAAAVPVGGFLQRDPDEGTARDRGDAGPRRVRRPRRLRGCRDAGSRPGRASCASSRAATLPVDADALLVYLDPHNDRPDRRAVRRVGGRRPARRAHLQRQLPRLDLGRRVGVGGGDRRRRMVRRDAHPALAVALPGRRPLHLGHQRPARHPAPQRIGVAAARPQERVRPGVEDGPPRGHRRHRPAHDAGAAAVRDGARGVHRAGAGGIAVQRRVAFLRRRRPRSQVRPVEQPHPRRHVQPGLRPGRGGPGRRQPLAVRDVLRGAAPVLHGGRQGVRRFRPQRRQPVPGGSSGPSRRSTTAAASGDTRR